MNEKVISELAPNGTLRAGINMANIFLVTGRTSKGDPDGVSPNIARAIADKLGVGVSYFPCATPGGTADTVKRQTSDIVMIANEPARAKFINFTDAYVEIEATFLVSKRSNLKTVEEVDQPGMRVAVSATSAYDLYLTRTLKNAELCRAEGLPAAVELFSSEKLDALAGLRPALNENVKDISGGRILDGFYMTVQQAIGTGYQNTEAATFLQEFVIEAKASGLISDLIKRHGVAEKLKVAV